MANKLPSTPALRFMKQHKLAFEVARYGYKPRGGTKHSSQCLGWPEHQVIKTLVFEDHKKQPLTVLMHGDCEVSAKKLARAMPAKSVSICSPQVATKHSGYQVGGTSPFAMKKTMPLYVQASILHLDQIVINAGARGVLMVISPQILTEVLGAIAVEVIA